MSLLPVITKVQERCVASRLVPHVKKILYPFQHGFQKGKSCVTRLLEVFYDIGLALDRGLESDIIYMDFAKAFYSVCPSKLVSKVVEGDGIGCSQSERRILSRDKLSTNQSVAFCHVTRDHVTRFSFWP